METGTHNRGGRSPGASLVASAKVAIVCAGDGPNLYAQMSTVVAAAVKRVEPAAEVVVVSDRPFLESRAREFVDDFRVVPTPFTDGRRSSRWLKVHLRGLLDGDFVFLDSDAVPVRPFLALVASTQDVAAAPDFSGLQRAGRFPEWARSLFQDAGWPLPVGPYLNSGVVYWPDTPAAHQVAEHWRRAWELTAGRGEYRDQPAFNRAMAASRVRPRVLDASLNAMVDVRPELVGVAAVLHFFVSTSGADDTILTRLVDQVSRSEPLDWGAVDAAVAKGTVWPGLTPSAVRARVAHRSLDATWRWIAERRFADAFWLAGRAWRLAPWELPPYAMLARVAVAAVQSTLTGRAPSDGT